MSEIICICWGDERAIRAFLSKNDVKDEKLDATRRLLNLAHPAFRGVGVTSSSISAPSNALPRFRTL